MPLARGTFEVEISPAPAELGGSVARHLLAKTFSGDLQGTGSGLMLSAGDPQAGSAGYVAIETIEAELAGRRGRFCLQQYGTMRAGETVLHYGIVPGSGSGELAGLQGQLELIIETDGTHRYELSCELEG